MLVGKTQTVCNFLYGKVGLFQKLPGGQNSHIQKVAVGCCAVGLLEHSYGLGFASVDQVCQSAHFYIFVDMVIYVCFNDMCVIMPQ